MRLFFAVKICFEVREIVDPCKKFSRKDSLRISGRELFGGRTCWAFVSISLSRILRWNLTSHGIDEPSSAPLADPLFGLVVNKGRDLRCLRGAELAGPSTVDFCSCTNSFRQLRNYAGTCAGGRTSTAHSMDISRILLLVLSFLACYSSGLPCSWWILQFPFLLVDSRVRGRHYFLLAPFWFCLF